MENIKKKRFHGESQPQAKFELMQHQRDAVNSVIESLKDNSRCQLHMACGTGKTFVMLKIMESLMQQKQSGITVVMIPSLFLERQLREEWKAQRSMSYNELSICSLSEKNSNLSRLRNTYFEDEEEDIISFDEEETSFVSTDIIEIKNKITSGTGSRQVIFCTYQSSGTLVDVVNQLGLKIDLILYDEAHRSSGVDNPFGQTVSDKAMTAEKRVFVTATPRTISETVRNRSIQQGLAVRDMNDEDTYGSVVYSIGFRQAIEAGILSDYRILVPTFWVDDLLKGSNIKYQGRNLTPYDLDNMDCEIYFQVLALVKSIQDYDSIRKIISFHRRVARAGEFAKLFDQLMPTYSSLHVSGGMPTTERTNIIRKLESDKNILVANAKVLTEGINIPTIDAVYFADPKGSPVDMIQAVGRALRKSQSKSIGYIIVPLILRKNNDSDDQENVNIKAQNQYNIIIDLISAMGREDTLLESVLTNFSQSGVDSGRSDISTLGSHFSFVGNHEIMDDVLSKILVEVIDRAGFGKKERDTDDKINLLVEYCEQYGHFPTQKTFFADHPIGSFWASLKRNKLILTVEQVNTIARLREKYLDYNDWEKYNTVISIDDFTRHHGFLPRIKDLNENRKPVGRSWQSILQGTTNFNGDHSELNKLRKKVEILKKGRLDYSEYNIAIQVLLVSQFCRQHGYLPPEGTIFKDQNVGKVWSRFKSRRIFESKEFCDSDFGKKQLTRIEDLSTRYLSYLDWEKVQRIHEIKKYCKKNGHLPKAPEAASLLKTWNHLNKKLTFINEEHSDVKLARVIILNISQTYQSYSAWKKTQGS